MVRSSAQNWPADTIQVSINSGNPAFPFPQFLEYKAGKTLATYNPEGVTHAEMEKIIREAYIIMMRRAIYSGESYGGIKYIKFNDNVVPSNYGTFVSEGDGYALLAAAYMGDKTTFNGLWFWVHDNRLSKIRQYKEPNCNTLLRPGYAYSAPLAGWQNDETTPQADESPSNSAADGDVDIALALVMAYRQWGELSGINDACGQPISYKNEALSYIHAMTDTVRRYTANNLIRNLLTGDVGFDGYLKGGNTFGEMTGWAIPNFATECPADAGSNPTFQSCPMTQYVDYNAPGYFIQYAKFLQEQNQPQWNIDQCTKAAASADWIMGQLYQKGELPQAGQITTSDDGSTVKFNSFAEGEDFRACWRTILNYVWHGPADYTWNPATHQVEATPNTYEYDNAVRFAKFLKAPGPLDASGNVTTPECKELGNDPTTGLTFNGVGIIRAGYAVGTQGGYLGGPNDHLNWTPGTGSASAVASGDTTLTALLYRQCEMKWDDVDEGLDTTAGDARRYILSTPKYFHGWFRLLGMLTTTGNLHAADNMIAGANVKVYLAVDKTFGFAGDVLNYTISYRNYGSQDASGVALSFALPAQYQLVSASDGGTLSGSNIGWSVGTVKGLTGSNGNIQQTQGTVTFSVKIRDGQTDGRVCANVVIHSSNGGSWTSNEYPNNITATMERNCVDILGIRSLDITKTADRPKVNPKDSINFTINFANSSKAGWLDGGRTGVTVLHGNGTSGPNTAVFYYRFFNAAQEAYINLSNYRVSYYINDAAISGLYNASTNPGGWQFSVNFVEGATPADMNLSFETIPYGSDTIGGQIKSWNQRLIARFPDQLYSSSSHLYNYFGKPAFIHKGILEPFRTQLKLETPPPTKPVAPILADDWSYNSALDVGQDDKSLFFPITPNWSDINNPGVAVTKPSPDVCTTVTPNYDRVLVEEFDGYTWRRIIGNGPAPGREMTNVIVTDTLPAGLTWGGFLIDSALGTKATYDPATRIIKYQVPTLLVAETGLIKYYAYAGGACPQTDQIVNNKAWIYSSTDSPLGAAAPVTITCQQLPPPPPPATTMHKTSDKASYLPGDAITYTITYKQTQGTIANPSPTSAADWTSQNNIAVTDATFTQSLSQPYNSLPKLITYDYSQGKNGELRMQMNTDDSQDFSLVFRYTGGYGNTIKAVMLEVKVNPMGKNSITLQAYNNQTPVSQLYNAGSYAGNSDILNFRVVLNNNTMSVWVNNLDGPPLYETSEITVLSTGSVGIYNANPSGNPSNGNQVLLNWWTNFDSAFDVAVSDVIPPGLAAANSITGGGTVTNGVIGWTVVSGKTNPMLYGDSVTYSWKSVVSACPLTNLVNTAYTNVRGQATNSIGAQSVAGCGAVISCTAPTTAVLSAGGTTTVCQGDSVSLSVSTDAAAGALYTWYKNTVDPANIAAGPNADLKTIKAGASADYLVLISAGNDPQNASCQKQSNKITVSITSKNAAPSVSVKFQGDSVVCKGVPMSFTVSNTQNGGAAPSYQWMVNGNPVGTAGSADFTSSSLNDKDTIYAVLTSSAGCVASKNAVSNKLIAGVTAAGSNPSVSIIQADTTQVCSGSAVNFKVTNVSNGGSSPSFQWVVDGKVSDGSSGMVFSSAALNDKDTVYVVLTSSASCAAVKAVPSNKIMVSLATPVTPQVQITSTADTICDGDLVGFSIVSLTGGGTAPAYQWYSNGTAIAGAASAAYSSATLADQSKITLQVTSSQPCANPALVLSNEITIVKATSVVPSVSIGIDGGGAPEVCQGDSATVDVTGARGAGNNPSYQWQVNGANVSGATKSAFGPYTFSDQDKVTVVMTTSSSCASGTTAVSAPLVVTVSSKQLPAIAIKPLTAGPFCEGSTVTFSIASQSGQGTAPVYAWFINGIPAGSGTGFTTTALKTGDLVTAQLTSNAKCVTAATASSAPVSVTILPKPTVNITSSVSSLCSGVEAQLLGTVDPPGGYTYTWRNGQTVLTDADLGNATATADGSYTLQVDGLSCSGLSDTIVLKHLTVDAGPDQQIASGKTAQLHATSSETTATYSWSPSGTDGTTADLMTVQPLQTTVYHVTATAMTGGCKATDSVTVTVIPFLFIPNAFTPNGDGNHETWEIEGWENFDKIKVEVFNRWGNKIYASEGSYKPWDGTYGGEMMPVATYYYVITLNKQNSNQSYSGALLLSK